MNGMKVALGKRGWTVQAALKIGKSGEPWCMCDEFHAAFLLGPVYFRTALPCSSGNHLQGVQMPLHDMVGINCKKGATTENYGSDVEYWSWCYMFYDCV